MISSFLICERSFILIKPSHHGYLVSSRDKCAMKLYTKASLTVHYSTSSPGHPMHTLQMKCAHAKRSSPMTRMQKDCKSAV